MNNHGGYYVLDSLEGARELPNGDTEYIVISGDTAVAHKRVTVTAEQGEAIYRHLSDFFDAGMERFGTVEAFEAALRTYFDAKAAA